MQFTFDLISDLHVDTWPTEFDWTHQATSAYCIVAGDVCRDRGLLNRTLQHLGQCYQAVFYIDGNEEHTNYINKLGTSYKKLVQDIHRIPDVVYLHDNVIVINGVAILGTNGWWNYDFDPMVDQEHATQWHQHKQQLTDINVQSIRQASEVDASYVCNSVKRLQTHNDVKKIVVVTHTLPNPELIYHDAILSMDPAFNIMGNAKLQQALDYDTEKKIHTWCFGHYHNRVDQYRDGVRYVNNCRGRGNSEHKQYAYYPLRITVEY